MDFEEWHKLNKVDEEMKLEQWGVKRLRLVMNDRNKMSRFEADLSIGVQDRRRQGSVELKVEMIRRETQSNWFGRLNAWADKRSENI